MDSQDPKIITASSTGHGVHLCHRCGWPFPNPHPSSRHRRAHKKVCGKIEGYIIIHSDGDHHVAVSDDEHNTSDEDGHTPNPKLVKKNSDNDVFADAVTEFSDIGISPRVDKSIEHKVEGDLCNSQLLEVDGTRDKSDLNDPPISHQIPSNANNESLSVVPSKEDKWDSDPQTLVAVETKEEMFDKFASTMVEDNLSPRTENVDNTVCGIALVEETRENVDSFVGVEKVSESVNQDVVSVVHCIDKKVEMVEDENDCEMAENENKKMGSNDKKVEMVEGEMAENENKKMGSNDKFYVEADISLVPKDDQIKRDSVNSTDLPTSRESENLEELSEIESISLANSFEKSVQEIDTGKEDIVHVTSDDVRVESADVDELKDDKDVVTSETISKDSKLLIKSEDVAENVCINENETSVVISTENSVGPASRTQDFLAVNEKCLNETSPDVDEHVNALNSKSVQDEDDDKPTAAIDLSNIRSDSLEANCGSVSAFSSQSNMAVVETSSKSPDTINNESNIYEPPSFMTLVQSSEIEKVHNNQHPKSDAHQAGWFPSITNVVNESEGRKKNEEIISKVTNWNPVKQQHGPLKNLLNEIDSPNTKQVDSSKDNGKDHETNKVIEEWNSPARYPIEIKKEKKKKRKPYWVPFVCCSSRHRDM